MVTAYLEIEEIQALNQIPMYVKDWVARLDDFLRLTGKDILTHAGRICHKEAVERAREEYEKYKERSKNELSKAERHFLEYFENESKKPRRQKLRGSPVPDFNFHHEILCFLPKN